MAGVCDELQITRACVFAIHENVYPGPKDARYVIKRLIRRAVLDGYQMNPRTVSIQAC